MGLGDRAQSDKDTGSSCDDWKFASPLVRDPAVLIARFWPRLLLWRVFMATFGRSFGVAATSFTPHLLGAEIGAALSQWMRSADAALYEAKHRG